MKIIFRFLLTVSSFVLLFSYNSSAYDDYPSLYKEFSELTMDPASVYIADNFSMMKDAGAFLFESGKFYFGKQLNGKVRVAVFIGKGNFTLNPPLSIERGQLERFYNKKIYSLDFNKAVIVFADDMEEMIKSESLKFDSEIPSDVSNFFDEFLKYETDKKNKYLNNDIVNCLLNNKKDGFFYSMLQKDDDKPVFFGFNPYDDEEVTFSQGNVELNHYSDLICQFPAKDVEAYSNYKNDPDIILYNINCKIDRDLIMNNSTEVVFVNNEPGFQWGNLYLFEKLKIKKLVYKGTDLKFHSPDESGIIWFKFPEPLKAGDTVKFTLDYEGRILNRVENYVYMESSIGWYPRFIGPSDANANFDIKYEIPENYTFCSIGEKISEENINSIVHSHWVTKYPTSNCSFNMGPFKLKLIEKPGLPKIYIGYVHAANLKSIIEDTEFSYLLYTKLFGENIYNTFYSTEILKGGGEAFPGLIHLDNWAFEGRSQYRGIEALVSHEVAHQWWGITVDYKSYRDRWLSEGFAEYSSMLYLQAVAKDEEAFSLHMKNKADGIIKARKSFGSLKIPTGAIGLGHRVSNSRLWGEDSRIVYDKGCWTLHMIRYMLMDIQNSKEDAFMALMKNFFQKYRGKEASTEDFKHEVEAVAGQKMDWFFEQWINDNKIPKYVYGYKSVNDGNDKFKVTLRVRTEDVPSSFKMIVPIMVDYGDDQSSRFKILIDSNEKEIELPLLPLQPKDIVFNFKNAVLCETDKDDFEKVFKTAN